MNIQFPAFLTVENNSNQKSSSIKRSRMPFLHRTLRTVAATVKTIYIHSESGAKGTILYRINPLVKFFSFIFFIVSISLAHTIESQLLASVFVLFFYFVARISYRLVYKKIFVLSFVFGLLIFLPALLNVITPGEIIFPITTFNSDSQFWIYHIPQTIGITSEGVDVVALLFLRILNSIALALLYVYSSSFSQITKGMKVFFIPDTFVMIMTLAYKYIFILSKTIEETYLALKSKLVGSVKSESIRKIISGRVFFIFRKSKSQYEYTYSAMVSRGYTGKIRVQKVKTLRFPDVAFLFITIACSLFIIFVSYYGKHL